MLQCDIDQPVAQVGGVSRSGVAADAWRRALVEHALQGHVRHGTEHVEGRSKLSEGGERGLAGIHLAAPAPGEADDLLPDEFRRDERRRWRSDHGRERRESIADLGGPCPVSLKHLAAAIQREPHQSAQHRPERMRSELEARHDAEVPAAAAQPPEDFRFLGAAGSQDVPGRGHHFGRGEVVGRQARTRVRNGLSGESGRITTLRVEASSESTAIWGISVMPSSAATIWTSVRRLVAWKTSLRTGSTIRHACSEWLRRQCPSSIKSSCSRARSSRLTTL